MHIALALLGPMEVTWAGKAISLSSATTRALLAYLALEADRPHARERIAALLWPDRPQSAAFNNLRQALARARQALPEPAYAAVLEVTQHTLRFKPDLAVVDVARFEELLAQSAAHAHAEAAPCPACLERMEQAAALYRGELLQGLFLEDSQPWEEWLFLKRETLHRQALDTFDTLARAAELAADYAAMGRYAQRQVALESWREEAHRQLMRALAYGGDRGAALVAYETCRRVLDQELGVAPTAETTALYDQINAGLPRPTERPAPVPRLPVPSPRRRHLPIPATRLVGRADELVRITGLLRDPASRLVTLVGPGGVGKTRLALAAARTLRDTFSDGAVLVDLAPISDPQLVVATIAQALDVPRMGSESLLTRLKGFLNSRQLLLLLDNFEHVIGAAPVVAELLEAAEQLTVLVTSRTVLHLRGEHQFDVLPLELPDLKQVTALEEVARVASIQLFVERSRAIVPGFVLTAENAAAVASICTHLDGLPLALELAASRVKLLAPRMLLQQLRAARLMLLTGGARDLPSRQQTLRGAIDWSYRLLDQEQQHVFARLSVFAGSWTWEAAHQICGVEDDTWATLQRVHVLLDQSLVAHARRWYEHPVAAAPTEDEELRFVLLETISEYARERLEASGEAEQVRARHAAYYLGLAEHTGPELHGPDQRRWLDLLEREHDNLRAALGWCLAGGEVEWGLRLAAALTEFWWPRDHLAEGRQWLARLLHAGVDAARGPVAHALYQAGQLAYGYGDNAEAESLLERSLTLYRELGDGRGIARVLRMLAGVTAIRHDGRAATLRQEALTLFRQFDDVWGVAWMLYHIAEDEPDATRRIDLYHECITLARSHGYKRTLVSALSRLGGEEHLRGDLNEAARMYGESLALSRDLDDRWTMAWSLGAIGGIARDRDALAEAIEHYEESLALHRRSGNQTGAAVMLVDLGDALRWQGHYVRATERYEESLRLFQLVSAPHCCALVLCGLGRVAMLKGDHVEAHARYCASLIQSRAGKDDAMAGSVLAAMAGAALQAPGGLVDDETFAARLAGAAADRPRSTLVAQRDAAEDARTMATIVDRLREAAWKRAWAEGQALTLEEAVAYALGEGSQESEAGAGSLGVCR